ncbi:MAG: cobalt-precorrin-7 (C(5))-methyltransferase [Halobacteriota archaeon]
MKIVGVGAGPGMLTQEAIEAIECAKVVYGSPRALAIASDYIKVEPIVLKNYDLDVEEEACILSTGDPMLSGLGKKAPPGCQVIPGISSLQLACARETIDIADVTIIQTHGKDTDHAKKMLETALRSKKVIFVVADSSFDVDDICAHLIGKGYDGDVTLLEDLGYKTERIARGTVSYPPVRRSLLFCILIRSIHERKQK